MLQDLKDALLGWQADHEQTLEWKSYRLVARKSISDYLVISEDGEEVQFIRTDQLDDQVSGDARRVGQGACSNLSLRGKFGASLDGSASGLPFAALDSVTADGSGSLSGKGTVSYNGTISRVAFTAAYAINPDCSGSIAFDTGTTQNLVVVGKGSEVRFIRTDSADAVVTGEATALRSTP